MVHLNPPEDPCSNCNGAVRRLSSNAASLHSAYDSWVYAVHSAATAVDKMATPVDHKCVGCSKFRLRVA